MVSELRSSGLKPTTTDATVRRQTDRRSATSPRLLRLRFAGVAFFGPSRPAAGHSKSVSSSVKNCCTHGVVRNLARARLVAGRTSKGFVCAILKPYACCFALPHFLTPAGDRRPSIARVNASVQSAGFLCPFEANTYGIDFLSFQIEDAGGSGAKLFEISKDPNAPPPQLRVDGIAGKFTLASLSVHVSILN